jgi:hypothetical protein
MIPNNSTGKPEAWATEFPASFGRLVNLTTIAGTGIETVRCMGKCMKPFSANVGLPRQMLSKDKAVTTGIFKEPVKGRVICRD